MEKLILGLLMMCGMSVYEMKAYIQKRLSTVCSASSGSIHTAIRKLLEKEFVTVSEVDHKKIYSITEEGRKDFQSWMQKPMESGKAKNMEFSKLFFFGMSKSEERRNLIMDYIKQLEEELAILEALNEAYDGKQDQILKESYKRICDNDWNENGIKQLGNTDELQDTVKEIQRFQHLYLKYGIDSIKFEIKWYYDFLKEM
ncbi:MAG: PadR family transcriptional regulator [Cellulosilyticum sp.]|nr:PadR family transcriptional regulator [Cellulosilyticum sp.]